MTDLHALTRDLANRKDLSASQCEAAAHALTGSQTGPADKFAFLQALHEKGESVDEVAAFARVFRSLAKDPQLDDLAQDAIDVVGTGGTGSHGFNVSSVTALTLAAAGNRVLKHGNRAITSASGSADFLGHLGIRMDSDPQLLRLACQNLNFCFFFAPAFHPAFKEIMPVRKELAAVGQRSIFNILGPLINPAKPAYQLLGVFSERWVMPLAATLQQLGLKSGVVVCCNLDGENRMDEFTTSGCNHFHGFGELNPWSGTATAADWGFTQGHSSELRGGNAEQNVALFMDLLKGRGPKTLLHSIFLNAAVAFLIMQRVESLADGRNLAREVFLGGDLADWLERARDFYHSST